MSYADMTYQELDTENRRLMAEKAAIREQQREVVALMDKKQAQEDARRKFDNMSDPEKTAFLQIVTNAGGIESAESVNGG